MNKAEENGGMDSFVHSFRFLIYSIIYLLSNFLLFYWFIYSFVYASFIHNT